MLLKIKSINAIPNFSRTREAWGQTCLEPFELYGGHRAHSLAPHALSDLLARVALLQPQQSDAAHTTGCEARWLVTRHVHTNTKTPMLL